MWLWLACCHFTALAVSKQMTEIAVVSENILAFSLRSSSSWHGSLPRSLVCCGDPDGPTVRAVPPFPGVSTTELLLTNQIFQMLTLPRTSFPWCSAWTRVKLMVPLARTGKTRQSWRWAAEALNLSYRVKIYSVCCLVSYPHLKYTLRHGLLI